MESWGENSDHRAGPSARSAGSPASCNRKRSGRSIRRRAAWTGARPFRTAPMACSRMPKCRCARHNAGFEFAGALEGQVWSLVDGARSAAPPSNQGKCAAMAFSALPEDSRVASPLASGAKVGRSLSQPLAIRHSASGRVAPPARGIFRDRPASVRASSAGVRSRDDRRRRENAGARRPARGSWSLPASHRCAWRVLPPQLRAARHERRWCRGLLRRTVADMAFDDDQRRRGLGIV